MDTNTLSPFAGRLSGGTGLYAQPALDLREGAAAAKPQETKPSRPAGSRLASEKQRDLLRDMIAERIASPEVTPIRHRLNQAREGGYLTEVIFTECFNALKAIPRDQAPASIDEPAVTSYTDHEVWPGTYTIETAEGHRTFRVWLQPEDESFAPGEMLLQYLSGPDNDHDYTGFAFLKPGAKIVVWKKFRPGGERYASTLLRDAEVFLADPAAALVSRHCARCNEKLSVPVSIERGYGPTCWTKVHG